MLPIPMMFPPLSTFACNNAISFPSVGTPTYWYKAGLTASTNTNGFNTVGYNSTYTRNEYSWWYDYSGNGANLSNTSTGVSDPRFEYSSNFIKNGLYYFGVPAGYAAYMSTTPASLSATAGKGTAIMVWRTATDNVNSIQAFAKPANSLSRGYLVADGYVTILGDTQTYVFSNAESAGSQWNITIVSVDSAGSPNTYKNNGVQGTTSSYINPLGIGVINTIAFDSYAGTSVAEFMWYETPLSSSQCNQVEDYLKQKWCIEY